MSTDVYTIVLFVAIIAITLGITAWASRRTKDTSDHYVAGGEIKGWQNGIAIAGDFLSAATFLGVTGLIAVGGFVGFYLGAGGVIAYLTLLVLIAAPLRNLGKYTMADALTSRFNTTGVRSVAALSTLAVSIPYMIVQLVGAGSLIELLLGVDYTVAVVIIGILMAIYITAGGMVATTWIQIIKAVMLVSGILAMVILVLARFSFNPLTIFNEVAAQEGGDLLNPSGAGGLVEGLTWVSFNVTFLLGAAGLPHVLIRFFTVPDAKAARTSAAVSLWIIAFGLAATPILGYGAVLLVGQDRIAAASPEGNVAVPLLAEALGGPILSAYISAVAFVTILAVVSGLAIAASGAFAHDIYNSVMRGGQASEREQLRAARIMSVLVSGLAILLSLAVQNVNIAILVAIPLVFAASANVPVILLTLYWKRFNTSGVIVGMLAGLVIPLILILISPTVMGESAIFPLGNPGLLSVPLGFLGCYLGTILGGRSAEREMREGRQVSYDEIYVRSNTGIGDADQEIGSEEPRKSRA